MIFKLQIWGKKWQCCFKYPFQRMLYYSYFIEITAGLSTVVLVIDFVALWDHPSTSTAARNVCSRAILEMRQYLMSDQKRRARDGEGLFVQVGTAEQQNHIAMMFCLVELEHVSQLPQLVQVWRELQPKRKKKQYISTLTYLVYECSCFPHLFF